MKQSDPFLAVLLFSLCVTLALFISFETVGVNWNHEDKSRYHINKNIAYDS